jgi:cytochrome c biogenesis protein
MKFAIWMLIILGVLSLVAMFVGEFYDPRMIQEPAASFSQIVVRWLVVVFQMDDAFSSWWYRLLLGVLCLSLFACILKRAPFVWRIWTSSPPDVSVVQSSPTSIHRESSLSRDEIRHKLSGLWRFHADNDKVSVAERGKLAMWGPLATHIGMLLLGIGALVTSFGSFTTRMGGYAGDTVQFDGLPFAVQIDSFRITYYPLQPQQIVLVDNSYLGKLLRQDTDGRWELMRWTESGEASVKIEPERIHNQFDYERDRGNIQKFSSFVTVLEDGVPVKKTEIAVNDPLRRSGFRFYQSSYDTENPRVEADYDSVEITLADGILGSSRTLFLKPEVAIQVPDDSITVKAGRLLPDFKIGRNNLKFSSSDQFINPGLELEFTSTGGSREASWVLLNVEQESKHGRYDYTLTKLFGERSRMEMATVFEIKYTFGTWILWLGFIIASLGLLLSFYITHRVLYLVWPEGARTTTFIIGTSRKMPLEFEKELERVLG